jgi:hypothetical protein
LAPKRTYNEPNIGIGIFQAGEMWNLFFNRLQGVNYDGKTGTAWNVVDSIKINSLPSKNW